nr:YopT-type cysteine protease domain-containing protein [Cystobacter fuscus]
MVRGGRYSPGRSQPTTQSVNGFPAPPWGATQIAQHDVADVLRSAQGIDLAGYVSQAGINAPGASRGVCSGIVSKWLSASRTSQTPAEASETFQSYLAEGRPPGAAMVNAQYQNVELNREYKSARTRYEAQLQDVQDGYAPPSTLDRLRERYEEASANRDFAYNGGMKAVSEEQSYRTRGDSNQIARDIRSVTQDNGFYRIHFDNLQTRDSHVVAMERKSDGSFRFMDPNTGDFTARNSNAMHKLLQAHVDINSVGPQGLFTSYRVDHLEIPPPPPPRQSPSPEPDWRSEWRSSSPDPYSHSPSRSPTYGSPYDDYDRYRR